MKNNNEISKENKIRVQDTLKELIKKFGEEAIMTLGNNTLEANIETFRSGSYLLDEALGIGGYPKGRIIEIYGPESSGKTTLCLHAIAEIQKNGGVAAFIDAEHSFDPKYAQALGINLEELIVSQPDSGEQALDIANYLAQSKAIDLIIVDSVPALVPQSEIDGTMEDQQIGLQARLMSKGLRMLNHVLSVNKTTIIFVNQIREKIGVVFGNPETTPGGRALKFYSSIRIEVRKSTTISEGKEIKGNEVKVKVVKNKLASPYKSFTTEIVFGRGIDTLGELIDLAVEYKIFERKGAWYSYNGENIAQGKIALKNKLEAEEEFLSEIENRIQEYKNSLK